MGNIHLLMSDLLERLEVEYIVAPPTTTKTLEIGVRHAPEFACLPLKITVGNFIEALDTGADTLLMAGGTGPCRFGYYAETQKRVMEQIGLDFSMVTFESPAAHPAMFVKAFKTIAPDKSVLQVWRALKTSFAKGRCFDLLEKRLLQLRAYEVAPGSTTAAYEAGLELMSKAKSREQIDAAYAEALALLDEVPLDREREVLKIGIVGEFYMLLEPFVNFGVERWLNEHDVYLERSVYLTDWIGPSRRNPVLGVSDADVGRLAHGYLSHHVGGEGQATIGHTMKYIEEGFDGIVHLLPFTCMPETIAKTIFPRLARDMDIPVLSFVIDEQTGKAGVITRLEAFLDLLWSRRRAKGGVRELVAS